MFLKTSQKFTYTLCYTVIKLLNVNERMQNCKAQLHQVRFQVSSMYS